MPLAPIDASLSGDSVLENAAAGTTVGTVTGVDPDPGATFTYALLDDAGGRFMIDATTGVITVANGANLDFEAQASHAISVRVTDETGLSVDKSFTLAVTDRNEAPTGATLTGGTVAENAAAGTIVGTVTGVDPDAGSTFTYALLDDAGGRFVIDAATGVITVASGAVLDFEIQVSHAISVRITDQAGLSVDKGFTLAITDRNETPTDATLTGGTVAENATAGTIVGTVAGVDPDAGSTFTYALLDDAGGRFVIDAATGVITVASGAVLDFEIQVSHAISVRITDQAGLSVDKGFTLAITDRNETPTDATLTGGTVAENATAGTIVGTVAGVDPDAGSTFTYALLDDAGGRFVIDAATGVITVASGAVLDFEAQQSHTVSVRVTDQAGLSVDKSFSLAITDRNETPTDATLTGGTVAENATAGTIVGIVAGVDPDAGSTFTYALLNDAGGRFVIDAATGVITVASGAVLDFEAQQSHTVSVRVTDQAGLSVDKSFSLAVADRNEAPTDATLTGGNVAEHATAGTIVGTVAGVDPDAGSTFTYAFLDDAGGRFIIDATTGVIRVASGAVLDFETQVSHAINVRITDQAGLSVDKSFTLAVTDRNEAPIDATLTGGTVAENATAGTVIGTVTGVDPDAGSIFTYTLLDDAGGRFVIDATTGVVTVASGAVLDFETQVSHAINVRVTDQAGLSIDKAFTINLSNVPDAAAYVGTSGDDIFVAPTSDFWTLSGLGGNDALTGNTAADVLIGGAGNDTLAGGAGDDQFHYSGAGDGFDNVAGGDGIDTIKALSANTVIGLQAIAGVEHISANGFANVVVRGDGTDNHFDFSGATLTGITQIDGGDGNDTIVGNGAANTLAGGNGNDTLSGGGGNDILIGGQGADVLNGDAGTDLASYAASGSAVFVSLAGGANTGGDAEGDVLNGIENLTGSAFDDALTGNSGSNVLTGGGGNDALSGGAGNDTLNGDAGNDLLDGGTGTDTLRGGTGDDIYLVDSSADVVSELAGQGDDEVRSSATSFTLGANIERLTFVGTGDFTGVGNGDANTITGGAGNDTLIGGAGADVLAGGAGIDTASYVTSVSGVTVDLSTGIHGGDAAGDVLDSIEIVAGSNHADILIGDATANHLQGGLGDDVLVGGGGTDTLSGGGGLDLASYASSSAGVTVNLTTGTHTGGDAEGDQLSGIENVTGSAFDDALTGDAGSNVLSGGAGNDRLDGAAGNDTLIGGLGDDIYLVDSPADLIVENAAEGSDEVRSTALTFTLGAHVEKLTFIGTGDFSGIGNDESNVLVGGLGNDQLDGQAGDDRLEGGDGDDLLTGGSGADVLLGGAGRDTASYASSGTAVIVDLATGLGTGGDAAGDILADVENLVGSAFADTLTGDANANLIDGAGGNDLMAGGGGDDVYVVDAAGDTVTEAADGGTDEIRTTLSSYTLGATVENLTYVGNGGFTGTGNSAANIITGGNGNDTLIGGGGADVLNGAGGNDTASYAASAAAVTVNLLTGSGSGGDATGDTLTNIENLVGSAYADSLTGDANANLFVGGLGADTINGGAGSDTASYAGSAAAVSINLATGVNSGGEAAGDILAGIENLIGSANADSLIGDGNANVITGGAGGDTINGGAGDDTASYATSAAGVTVNLTTGIHGGGDATGDVISNIENLIGSGFADNLTGTAGNNVIAGGGGDDWLYGLDGGDRLVGGDGDDRLIGGAGADALIGGAGTDWALYNTATAAVRIDLVSGAHTGDAAGDTFDSIERISGSIYNDSLFGDANANSFWGGDGNDYFEGRGGADMLDGGMFGSDTAAYTSSGAAVTVNLATNVNTGGDAAGDSLIDIENVHGSAFDDTLTGNTGNNVLIGNGGNDILDGGAGTDTLSGGAGDDIFIVDSSSDVVFDFANEGNDEVRATAASYTLNAQSEIERLTFIGTGNFTGTGNAGNNIITGGAGVDVLYGLAGNDTLIGGDGNDWLIGGAGADALIGGAGSDIAQYFSAAAGVTIDLASGQHYGDAAGDTFDSIEMITGSNYRDQLYGDANANNLWGEGGDDYLVGRGGADELNGGGGFDTAGYTSSSAGVTINLATNINTGGEAAGDRLFAIENIDGSAYDDAITGDASVNDLRGGAGNDILDGGAGNDTLYGGAGDDIFIVDSSSDVVFDFANEGNDEVRATAASYTLNAQSEIERLTFIGTGSFTGTGNASNNVITGGAGNDTLSGLAGNDTLIGGDGSDSLIGGAGADSLIGGAGLDWAQYATATSWIGIDLASGQHTGDAAGDTFDSIEYISGSNYGDNLAGDANANYLWGEGGDDYLVGRGGADILHGGVGTDTAAYTASDAAVTINLVTNVNTGGEAAGDILASIENIHGSAHDDVLTGDTAANVFMGNAGNDFLDGGAGNDTLFGGAGDDVFIVDSLDDIVYEFANEGNDEVRSTAASYVLKPGYEIERLTYTGAGSFTGTGNEGNNIITGGTGSDVLYGLAGNDTLVGGDGNDWLVGGAGADALIGGAGLDWAQYFSATSAVTIDLASGVHGGDAAGDTFDNIEYISGSNFGDHLAGDANANYLWGEGGNDYLVGRGGADILHGGVGTDTAAYTASDAAVTINLVTNVNSGGEAAGDILASIENIHGSAHDDVLTGDTAANVFMGNTGNDFLDGGAGNDTLFGGAGDDVFIVDSFNDIVYEFANEGNDEVRSTAASYVLKPGYEIERLTYIGTGSFTGTGNEGNNIITGGSGSDTLSGLAGNDILIGGDGNDILIGGADSDTFVFAANFGKDTINDFSAGAAVGDVIQISSSIFADYAAVRAASAQIGADVLITVDASNSILLKNVALVNLHQNDFQFS
ncbi:Bifunctional hemolysin/adenylate cyclase precursor [bacterium YEK0313]|nr:Bifunctional hemolysin/adenylate cyclase precursor [bacterium YEK0313]